MDEWQELTKRDEEMHGDDMRQIFKDHVSVAGFQGWRLLISMPIFKVK